METGIAQRRNAQMRSGLDDSFLRNRTFFEDGARLFSAVRCTFREGGGNLIEGWMADSDEALGEAGARATRWSGVNIAPDDYAATPNGGPYVDLDGALERYAIGDATWQEAGTEEIFAWRWVQTRTLASQQAILAKWVTNTNNRSWKLWYDSAGSAFTFTTNATGAAAADVSIASSYAEAIDTWYFVAGYWKASTIQNIYVGAATDMFLTRDSTAVGVSASVFDTTGFFAMGSISQNNDYWNGYIGVGHTRFNTPSASIDGYAARLFQLTKWFYQ